jgi:hypothetical protein
LFERRQKNEVIETTELVCGVDWEEIMSIGSASTRRKDLGRNMLTSEKCVDRIMSEASNIFLDYCCHNLNFILERNGNGNTITGGVATVQRG